MDRSINLNCGYIILANLDGAVGYEKRTGKNGTRPCVVIQNDNGNKHSPTTIVAPLTDAKQYKGLPVQLKVSAAELGPGFKGSVIECGHIPTIDRKERIIKHLGTLPPPIMEKLDNALKVSLGLAP